MSKVTLKGNLTKNSFGNLAKQVELYKRRLNEGVGLGVEQATMELYDLIIKNCKDNNITIHHNNIFCKYDKDKKQGVVYTDDIVIIFNEFGTGIEGTQDEWANEMGYQVNESGKGQDGWYFYNREHNYGGITHGIRSKHMFINALKEIEQQLAKNVSIAISKTVGKMY